MQRLGLYGLLLVGIVTSSYHCGFRRDEMPPIKMKLIASFCAHHIVQIQDSAFYLQGMTWTNSQGTTYEHVFTVWNHCDFARSGIATGQEFMARIVGAADNQNCATCLGFLETPPLGHNLQVER